MASITASQMLPSAMKDKLQSIRRRLVTLAVLRALAAALTVLLLAMIVAMTIDWWFTLFNTGIRVTLTVSTVLAAIGTLLATGFRPLQEALRTAKAATSADDAVPQLEERWTTVASFSASQHQPTDTVTRAMLQQVTSEAIALGQLVKPAAVAQPRALRPMLSLLGIAIIAFTGFLLSDRPLTSVLLRRFLSPTQNITATQLASVTGDVRIPRGEELQLVIQQNGVTRRSGVIELTDATEVPQIVPLQTDVDRVDQFVYPVIVDESFRYRVLAGDGRTEWNTVQVIDYPELAEVRFTVTAPEYVDRPAYEKTLIPGRVRVIQGSQLELRMKPSHPLEKLEIGLLVDPAKQDSEPVKKVLQLRPGDDGWYTFSTQLIEDLTFSPTLLNSDGLTNEDPRTCRIQVVPDKAPVARIVSPNDQMAVAADEVIDIEFEAHDDHGIAEAELVIYDDSRVDENGEPMVLDVRPIPLGDQLLNEHIKSHVGLDLRDLNLTKGANISYSIRVRDNRDLQIDPATIIDRHDAASATDDTIAMNDESTTSDNQSTGESDSNPPPGSSEQQNGKSGSLQSEQDRNDASQMLAAAEPSQQSESTGNRASTQSDGNPAEDGTKPSGTETPESQMPLNEGSSKPNSLIASAPDRSETDPKSGGPDGQSTSTTGDETVQQNDMPVAANGSASKNEASGKQEPSDNAVASVDPSDDNGTMPTAASEQQNAQPEPQSGAVAAGDNKPNADPADSMPTDASTDSIVADNRDNEEQQARNPPPNASESTSTVNGNTPQQNASADQQSSSNSSPTEITVVGEEDPEQETSQNRGGGSAEEGMPREQLLKVLAQRGTSQQNGETVRRKLRITDRLLAVADSSDRRAEKTAIRDRVVGIDRQLQRVEEALTQIVERNIPDSERSDAFRQLDEQLGATETYIADLRNDTRDQQFAFVGLQMVHIGTTHVTPARNKVFLGIREPLGTDSPTDALHHVTRAREMLNALLRRYDRVAQEEELAGSINYSMKTYEVYVEKMQTLMREARQARNPLQRKMAEIEVNQEYLDRYAEVLKLRREMMAEFARMLGDDPRLMARYMELLRRRRDSLRDQVSQLAERQDEIAAELSGWLQVSEAQRPDLWMIVAEMRLHTATELAKEADGLHERVSQSMPLVLADDQGTAALVIRQSEAVASLARAIGLQTKRMLNQSPDSENRTQLPEQAEQLQLLFGELDAALDQLAFENDSEPDVTVYVNSRLAESRAVADMADAWAQIAAALESKRYSGLAEMDQQAVAVATELLRMEMQGIEEDLEGQFQQVAETDLPGEIADMVRELHRVMESLTFNQQAATFSIVQDQLESAENQQQRALENFDKAEKLFDMIRRATVAALDEYDVDDPDIANLVDPTLDAFLARLEREPNIEAQLGIPGRPRNLRVLADAMMWQQPSGDNPLGYSEQAARARAQKSAMMNAGRPQPQKEDDGQQQEEAMTDEEREE
ncbi:MAG: hypothetical protein KDA85_00500, partial [Planctomycetaceae bacterium]|nr:hypothetical protein [Planctomycetaceae bacterium]